MKPLYWTRIVAPVVAALLPSPAVSGDEVDSTATTPSPTGPKVELWQEIDEAQLDNLDEFTELFSRQAVAPKPKPEETIKPIKKKQKAKVLDSKRSQNVGIFARSLHVDFSEIEHAIYHCDTSVISLEALQTIMEMRATAEELESIKEIAKGGEEVLDNPEQFLLQISSITSSAERISCIVFQAEFDEGFTAVTRKLDTLSHLCEYLMESDELKRLFSIILALGNFMNGGNRARGQADGFGLEILGKLKDVKSKDSKVTLLHFIVKTYIQDCRKGGIPLPEIRMPIPDPLDVDKSLIVDFDDCLGQLNKLKVKLDECIRTTEKVVEQSTDENLQPFKDKMEVFIKEAEERLEKQYKQLEDGKVVFIKTVKFYKFLPKSGTFDDVVPQQFFELWTQFVIDFRDIWKKEMAFLVSQL